MLHINDHGANSRIPNQFSYPVGFFLRAALDGIVFAGTVLFAVPFVLAARRRNGS